jgi:hypothetical protein
MMFRMDGLVKRGGVRIYRRSVPARLRTILGCREVKRSLGTGDEVKAQLLWRKVKADIDAMFQEAEKSIGTPALQAYTVVKNYQVQERSRRGRPPLPLEHAPPNC